VIDKSKPPLPPVIQRASDDVSLQIEWEDGAVTDHYYRPGMAEYLTRRYTPEAKASGAVPLAITYGGSTHDGDKIRAGG